MAAEIDSGAGDLAERTEQTLRFPSKLAVLPDGRLVVSDAGQHRLVVFQADGATVDAIIGTGERGHADGDEDTAQFAEPNGVLALPAEVAQELGVRAMPTFFLFKNGEKVRTQVVRAEDCMEGIPAMIETVQVEATFPDGTKLVTVHHPIR